MARNWKDVLSYAKPAGLIDDRRVRNARSDAGGRAGASSAHVRKAQARTQTEVADAMHVSQIHVSTIERGELTRTQLGTLESYVEATGGHPKVITEFSDDTVTLH